MLALVGSLIAIGGFTTLLVGVVLAYLPEPVR